GWQRLNTLAVVAKASAIAAVAAPDATVYTGMGTVPLNFQFGFAAPSGIGKGLCMAAPLIAVGRDGKPVDYVKRPAASGEMFVELFYTAVEDETTGKPKTVRHDLPVICEWTEVDSFAAKTSNKGNTLDPYLRSAWSGEDVGDVSISRQKDKAGMILTAGTYRSIVTMGVQPKKSAPLLRDGGGGSKQRTIWFMVPDHEPPRKAAAIREVRDELAAQLGLHVTPLDPPTLSVHGPGSIVVEPEIQDEVLERRALVLSEDASIHEDETHRDNNRIRIAAIYAGWVAGAGNTAVVDAAAWRWADAVMESSSRTRESITKVATMADIQEATNRGDMDGVRRLAAEMRVESANEAMAHSTLERVRQVLTKTGPLSTSGLKNGYLTQKQRKALDDALVIGEVANLVVFDPDARRWAVTEAGRIN
ncbi:MAG: hypothetical protein KDB26_05675, partial [Microthrixaceae bacterium]|nr:hypothetical protein [Microthrixaceae bacterium]